MTGSLDFATSEEQQAVAGAVARFCETHAVERAARDTEGDFPLELWRALAAMGIFAPAAPGYEDAGGALELQAICATLGEYAFPGPVAATYAALQVLTGVTREQVMAGDALVSLSGAGDTLLPYGTVAGVFLIAGDDGIHHAEPASAPAAVRTLGGEAWGRAALTASGVLKNSARGLVIGDIARSAYLTGIAARLVRETSEHAATRKQFGKTLGEFQAVSHPLADCAIAVAAANTLAHAAAAAFDARAADDLSPDPIAAARRLAAGAINSARRGALATAYACHQVYGGIGMTLEGPAFHLTRRIRQVASEAPARSREQSILLADAGLGN